MVTTLIEYHELAAMFPLMEGVDYEDLKRDIQTNGQREAIWLYEGKILDGRNRYRACMDLGLEPRSRDYIDNDPLGFVISMNIHRRHLTAEKKREIIAELLKLNPQLSDRAIATQAKVSPTTVGEVRKVTVQSGQSNTRTGVDGKKRKAPRSKGGEISKGKKVKQVEAFKKMWEDFEDWQQRSFVKLFKDRLAELLEEVESEADASVEVPDLEVA
jgi:hypothetical protein